MPLPCASHNCPPVSKVLRRGRKESKPKPVNLLRPESSHLCVRNFVHIDMRKIQPGRTLGQGTDTNPMVGGVKLSYILSQEMQEVMFRIVMWFSHNLYRTSSLLLVKVKIKVKVMLLPTVSRPVSFGVKHPSGPQVQNFISVRDFRVCWSWALSLTRGRVCRLQLLLVFVSVIIIGTETRGTLDHILLSQIGDSPNLVGQVPVFISPRNRVAQFYPRNWVPFSPSPMSRRATV
jgi:hypothetical protein